MRPHPGAFRAHVSADASAAEGKLGRGDAHRPSEARLGRLRPRSKLPCTTTAQEQVCWASLGLPLWIGGFKRYV